MKLTLSYSEAQNLIRKHLGLNEDVAVEISNDVVYPISPELTTLINAVDKELNGGNKIAAIREYRNYSGEGLWESKNIVERWDGYTGARNIILTKGRLPRVCHTNKVVSGLE